MVLEILPPESPGQLVCILQTMMIIKLCKSHKSHSQTQISSIHEPDMHVHNDLHALATLTGDNYLHIPKIDQFTLYFFL